MLSVEEGQIEEGQTGSLVIHTQVRLVYVVGVILWGCADIRSCSAGCWV